MAKKPTTGGDKPKKKKASPKRKGSARPQRAARSEHRKLDRPVSESEFTAADALLKLMESPLVADLLAVGATAALAAITESRSGRKNDPDYKSSRALKAAGKAAAAAMGRRVATEFEEIRSAAKTSSARKGS